MNSTLTLIYGSQVLPERNFKVPSLNDIVSKADATTTISNFMYVKHALDLTIKINKSQLNLTFDKATTHNLNYVIIQNITSIDGEEQKKVGYFVIDKKWIAESTIELTLHCDVVNTFIDDCELSDKTKILRQHKDRYEIDDTDFDKIISVSIFEPTHDEATWGMYDLTGLESGVVLYDLTMTPPTYTDDGDTIFPYVRFSLNEFVRAKIYAVDDNYRVIQQLATFLPYITDRYIRIDMERKMWKVESFGSNTSFPSGTKYLALRYEYIDDVENAGFEIFPEGYDELEEDQQLELQDTMLCYINKFGQYHEKSIFTRYAKPKIDFYSEGLQPQLYGLWGGKLEEQDVSLNQNWYLIYRNQNDPDEQLTNPVDVFLCGEQNTYIEQMTKSTTAEYTWEEMVELFCKMNSVSNITQLVNLREGYGLFFPYAINYGTGTAEIKLTGHNSLGATTKTFSIDNSKTYVALVFSQYNNIPVLYSIYLNSYGEQLYASFWVEDDFKIKFTDIIKATIGNSIQAYDEIAQYPASQLFATGTGTATIVGIETLNRTDAKLIKVIKLPYCPANVSTASGTGYLIYDTTQWEYDGVMQMLKLKKFNTFFNRWLKFEHNPLDPLKPLSINGTPPNSIYPQAEEERNILYETKLYHSDFYYEKYYYDSFSFAFQLEFVQNYVSTFNVSFQVSNTINSRFLFTFQGYQADKYLRDYNNILYIARNNEIALFNQQYINYIRTGYNYDIKSLQLTEEQIYKQELLSGISGAGNLALSGASMLTKLASSKSASVGSSALAYIGQASGFATSTLGMLYNDAYTIQQNELSLHGKMTQLRNQATGVIDANDVDLMSYYTGNRLRYRVYRCSEKMRTALWKLFFYTGYVADIQGIPDTTSRIYFNFVQADVQFKKVPNLPASYITELKAKYMEGITFLHKYNNKIDFDQQYENWETKFFEE